MPIHRPVSDALVELLKPIAREFGERLGTTVASQTFPELGSSAASIFGQHFKKDPRWIQAQMDYLQRQRARERELIIVPYTQQDRAIQIKEEEQKDRQEMSRLCRTLMCELQAEAIQLKLSEIQTLWDRDTWFSNLSRQETEQILQQKQHRLLILVAPAKISKDCPDSFRHNLNIELPAKLRSFLSQYYTQHNDLCPVQFYGDYFKQPISDIDVERLQTVLGPVPTTVLYSDISDYEVNFHVGFWGLLNQKVSLIPMQPWNWEQAYEQLTAEGKDKKHSLRIIRQIIVAIHKLLAAFVADLYYLSIDFNYDPQLYKLEGEFNQEWFSQEWVKPYIEKLREIQRQQRFAYEGELRRLADREARAKAERQRLEDVQKRRLEEGEATFRRLRERTGSVKHQVWKCRYTLPGHSSFVNTVAISPNHSLLASGSWDKTIKLWNLKTGELIKTLTGHSDRVNSVAISGDGSLLVSGSFDETIKLWSLPTGELIRTVAAHSIGVNSVAISPDGQAIASCGGADNTIKLWHQGTGELLLTLSGHAEDVNAVVFSPDGKLLATGSSDATSKIWDIRTGKLQRTLSGLNLGVNSVAISPDGQTLASVSNDYTIKLRNLYTGKLLRILSDGSRKGQNAQNLGGGPALHILRNYVSRGNSVAISPDGLTLISGSDDHRIKIWNLATGELISTLTGHSGTVYSVAIAPDGKTIVSGSSDETLKIWHCD